MTGIIDVHCHILPGVDDGAADWQTAVRLLERQYQEGVRQIIATPHYRRRMFEPEKPQILNAYYALQEQAARMGMNLYLGCEYHVNMEIAENILSGAYPSMANSRYVLSEFSSASEKVFIKERCYHMLSRGLVPVLAHVERYHIFRKDLDFLDELSKLGCLIQVNAGSILGEDGFKCKQFCKKVLSYEMVDIVASDGHDLRRRAPRLGECANWLEKKVGHEYAEHMLVGNPQKILENR